jgi:hypothetical protein
MKKLAVSLFALFVLGVFAQSAFALPPVYPVYEAWLTEAYAKSPVIEVVKEAKCDVCHYGTTKTNRNDYGVALSKIGLTKENHKKLASDKEKLNTFLMAVFKRSESAKSVSGKTFGELLKEGKLPGTVIEGVK